MCHPSTPAARRPPRAARGFTLAEILVALVLLAWGALAVAALSAALVRAVSSAELQTLAAETARNRLEQLAAGACASLGDGAAVDSTRGINERWAVVAGRNGARTLIDTVTYRDRGAPRRVTAERLVVC